MDHSDLVRWLTSRGLHREALQAEFLSLQLVEHLIGSTRALVDHIICLEVGHNVIISHFESIRGILMQITDSVYHVVLLAVVHGKSQARKGQITRPPDTSRRDSWQLDLELEWTAATVPVTPVGSSIAPPTVRADNAVPSLIGEGNASLIARLSLEGFRLQCDRWPGHALPKRALVQKLQTMGQFHGRLPAI